MKTLEELVNTMDRTTPKNVAVAQAADEEVLKAVKMARDSNLADFLLVGDKGDIENKAQAVGLDLTQGGISVVHATHYETARTAVKAVHDGEAHVVMKGQIDTKSLLKAVLDKEYGLRKGSVLSHVALFEIPGRDKLIFLTDSAMNITPSLQEKTQIIENAVEVAVYAGWNCPKVAMLAAVEVVNPAMEATQDAAIVTQMNRRGQIKGCIVDGPLAFDNAVDPKAAEQKGVTSEVAGQADILVVPSIEVANALYKSFIYFAKGKVAGVISGAKAPIVLTSRADNAQSKIYSLALALKASQQ
ncbi:phosphate butyryltransferase [Halobacillus karajensis]|uniref:Phosphate acetyltransferase n=1 Tax=Halobacillus karajensis TaxID=195088 RepID=A0A024P7F8_9BACI|nr:phosphate butyryltransferase [Halobacillus karajensis]CDQ17876.1 Phosphate acetyltransferase [Halobacillus karajensis]CDQ24282.1 Phosphate acetyltransferase [Halobacillus karajensis]CDQ29469.1 Phosphate acetyltransferase [Halobacillus karajensis]